MEGRSFSFESKGPGKQSLKRITEKIFIALGLGNTPDQESTSVITPSVYFMLTYYCNKEYDSVCKMPRHLLCYQTEVANNVARSVQHRILCRYSCEIEISHQDSSCANNPNPLLQYSALRSKQLISAPTPAESPYNLKHISSGVSTRTFVARDDTPKAIK